MFGEIKMFISPFKLCNVQYILLYHSLDGKSCKNVIDLVSFPTFSIKIEKIETLRIISPGFEHSN